MSPSGASHVSVESGIHFALYISDNNQNTNDTPILVTTYACRSKSGYASMTPAVISVLWRVVHHEVRRPDGVVGIHHGFVVVQAIADFPQDLFHHQYSAERTIKHQHLQNRNRQVAWSGRCYQPSACTPLQRPLCSVTSPSRWNYLNRYANTDLSCKTQSERLDRNSGTLGKCETNFDEVEEV